MEKCGKLSTSEAIAFATALVRIVGSDNFFAEFVSELEQRLGFNHFHVFLYRKSSTPIALANCPTVVTYPRGLHNYLTYTYVINPAYRAFQSGIASGIYLISELVNEDKLDDLSTGDVDVHIEESEPIGYRTPGWPKNMAEVIALISIPGEMCLDISVLTSLDGADTEPSRRVLKQIFPILEMVILKHFEKNGIGLETMQAIPGQEDKFRNFGHETLTTREQEVAQMILVGYGSSSMALKLGVALTTIKTHRRNIYAKLQISSQAELFSLFLLHLK